MWRRGRKFNPAFELYPWLRTVDIDDDYNARSSEEVKLESALEEAIENEETVDVWKPYVCKSLDFGLPHPGDIVEAASLSTVNLPSCSYPLQDSLKQQIEDGSLSSMQLEGIMFASERHSRYLPDGRRAGFFVGDSAGVGKGRQMAGIILDNLLRCRSRHVWFSASRDLHLDATRDLRDIGCKVAVYDSVASLSKKLERGDVKEAVVFCTYMELTSQGAKGSALTRFDELVHWLCGGSTPIHRQGFDGVLVFDECHKAKNYFEGRNQKNSTKAGSFVVKLQEQLPNARVVYSSATGISAVENMGYMARMGLWGAHTSFADFGAFSDAIGGGKSVAALEMLALEFKATGCQVARNVGYHGAEFSTVSANLSPTDAQMYRAAADLWHEVYTEMMKAHNLCNKSPDDGRFRPTRQGIPKGYEGTTVKMFWSAHQRFMRQLIAALKVPALAHIANESLKAGYCVVIGLQTTGEASLGQALEEEMEEYGLESKEAIVDVLEGGVPEGRKQGKRATRILASQNGEFVSICKTILRSFILKWFPTKQVWVPVAPDPPELPYLPSRWELVRELWLICRDVPNLETKMFIPKILSYLRTDNRPKNAPSRNIPAYDAQGNIFECQRMQSRLLAKLNSIYLPPSALDDLIDRLGGQNEVAELTGRTIRQVRLEDGSVAIQSRVKATSGNGKRTALYALGNGNNAKMSLNVQEKCAFMDGDKLVAIISEAASTGISLHADRKAKNQRRRVHCTLELPWAADQAIQQLGRSHRTNQTSAPIFRLLSSGLGGEHRFISSVSRRLQSLGALTQGDRRASVGAMTFGEFQFESDHGRNALKALYDAVMARKLPENVDWRDIARQSWEHMKLDFGEEVMEGDEWTESILHGGTVAMKKPPSNSDVWCPPANPYMKTESEFFDALEEAARFTGDLQFTTDTLFDYAPTRRSKSRDKFKSLDSSMMRLGTQGPRRLVPVDQSSFQSIVKDVPRFFNRILGLPFSQQALLFNLFNMLLEEDIKEAKRNGKFERGVQILDGQNIARLREPELLYRDPGTGGKLVIHAISRDRGVPFKDVIRELRYRIAASKNPSVKREDFPIVDPPTPMSLAMALNEALDDAHFFRSNKEIFSRFRTCLAIRIGISQWKIIRPGTGVFSSSQMADEVLMRNYHVVTNFKKLQKYWNDEFTWSENECTHGPNCKVGSACVVGRRKFETNILTGNVISLWSSLQNLITSVSSIPKSERIMSIVQTNITTTKERVVGIVWPMPAVSSLRTMVAEMKRDHDVKRRTVNIRNYPVNNVVRRPSAGSYLSFDERERYYQKEAEFNRWCSSTFTQPEQLKVLGFALNDECKVISPTQRAEQLGVREGFQLFLIGATRIESRKNIYQMRRTIADHLGHINDLNRDNRINSLTFLRPYTERDREEDERLWREGLAREPATPVEPEIVARLVADPATLRARIDDEDPVAPKAAATRKSKRKRLSGTSAKSSDENENDFNLGDEDDMDLEGTPERISTGSDFQLTEAEAAMEMEEEEE